MTEDAPKQTGASRAWREFWRGLARPSLPGLLIALAFCAGCFLSCLAFVTPELMASDLHWFLARDAADDFHFVTAKVLALPRGELSQPGIFILGGSAEMESITSEEDLARRVRDKTGFQPVVRNLAAGGQTTWEAAALADRLPLRFDGVVLLTVKPVRVVTTRRELDGCVHAPRLGFTSGAFDREASLAGTRVPTRTGNYFWDNRKFFLPRCSFLVRNLVIRRPLRGPIRHEMHRITADGRLPQDEWDASVSKVRGMLESYDERIEAFLAAHTRMVENLAARGRVSVVLMESPTNPRFVSEAYGQGLYTRYKRRLRQYAEQHGLSYWNVTEAAALKEEDFADATHLRTHQARSLYTEVLADRLSAILSGGPRRENAP